MILIVIARRRYTFAVDRGNAILRLEIVMLIEYYFGTGGDRTRY